MYAFSKLRQLLSIGIFFGASASLASLAVAQTDLAPDGSRIERVSFADLNLSSAAGQKVLHKRIHEAADDVCGPAPDWIPFSSHDEYRTCMDRAQRNAMQSVVAKSRGHDGAELAQLDGIR